MLVFLERLYGQMLRVVIHAGRTLIIEQGISVLRVAVAESGEPRLVVRCTARCRWAFSYAANQHVSVRDSSMMAAHQAEGRLKAEYGWH